jgi:general transcriptional corepressor TUP1
VQIWDIQKKSIRNVFDGHQQEIYSLDFSQDGRLIVSGSGDKTARIWSMQGGACTVLTINDPDALNNDAGVTSVAISPDGRYVAAGSLDTVVRMWDVATGQLIERLRGHRDSVYSVAFTPDGQGLVSGSLDKTLKYWDVGGLNSSKRKETMMGGREKDKSPCTMNFLGHKVSATCTILGSSTDLGDSPLQLGLCTQCCCIARRAMGSLRLQGPWGAVLGFSDSDGTVHAARAQELGHLH